MKKKDRVRFGDPFANVLGLFRRKKALCMCERKRKAWVKIEFLNGVGRHTGDQCNLRLRITCQVSRISSNESLIVDAELGHSCSGVFARSGALMWVFLLFLLSLFSASSTLPVVDVLQWTPRSTAPQGTREEGEAKTRKTAEVCWHFVARKRAKPGFWFVFRRWRQTPTGLF